MNMRIIPCMVTDEYVRGAGAVVGAAGSHDDVALELSFNDTWKDLAKTITWLDAYGENPTLTLLGADMLVGEETYVVPIPAPPKAHAGQMMMTIKGAEVTVDGTESAATMSATAYFEVLPSAWDKDAEAAQDIPATLAEQVHAEMVASVAKIEGMEVSAAEGAEAGVTKEVTETGIALRFTLPVGNLDDELAKQQESLTEQETLAKEIASTLAKKKAGTSIDLGIESATVGQIAQITKVDENGKPTAWMPVDLPSGGGGDATEEVWEFLTEATLEEEVKDVTLDCEPMKKIRVVAYTPAASADTNYMPIVVGTDENEYENHKYIFRVGRFYPTALPRKAATTLELHVAMEEYNGEIIMRLNENKNFARTADYIMGLGGARTASTDGNSTYSQKFNNNFITGVQFNTYSTFPIGSTFKVWGVRA